MTDELMAGVKAWCKKEGRNGQQTEGAPPEASAINVRYLYLQGTIRASEPVPFRRSLSGPTLLYVVHDS